MAQERLCRKIRRTYRICPSVLPIYEDEMALGRPNLGMERNHDPDVIARYLHNDAPIMCPRVAAVDPHRRMRRQRMRQQLRGAQKVQIKANACRPILHIGRTR